MKLSPIHINFALAFHVSPNPEDELGSDHFHSMAGKEVREWLYLNGMIDRDDSFARGTDKLAVWIEHLCNQPLPEKHWIVPS